MSRRFTSALALCLALAACGTSEPSGPVADRLWTANAPAVLAGATSAVVTVELARAGSVAWTAYTSAQQLTAAQVREDAAGGTTRSPVKRGTIDVPAASQSVTATLAGLSPATTYFVYVAAAASSATPAPTDSADVKSATATTAALQPGQSYQSTALGATVGYYTYLPDAHYTQPSQTFPLMIFLHGAGEKGNGTTELSRVLVHGPPKLVNAGRAFPFVIVSPQLPASQGGWSVALVDELIARAKANFRVDTTRIYVTGLSMGGFGTFAYAAARPNVVAAVVPIAGAGNPPGACAMKNVPLWAFHGDADGTVNVSGSVNMVNAINACTPAPAVAAKLTIYPGVGHDSWTRTYDGSAGNDIYTWLLQYRR